MVCHLVLCCISLRRIYSSHVHRANLLLLVAPDHCCLSYCPNHPRRGGRNPASAPGSKLLYWSRHPARDSSHRWFLYRAPRCRCGRYDPGGCRNRHSDLLYCRRTCIWTTCTNRCDDSILVTRHLGTNPLFGPCLCIHVYRQSKAVGG